MKRTFLHLSLATLLAYLGLCAWLYAAQDSLLYFPTPEVNASEADALLLRNGDAVLKVWKVGNGENAVVYFGGNGENVGRNINNFNGLLPDTAVYLLNYRGYGGSSGKPGEAAFFADAAFLFDHLHQQHRDISVIGRSLGTGVAVWLAANRPVNRLVLVTPYDSIEDIAAEEYPYAPISLLLRDKYRSIDYASRVNAPLLLLVAETDRIVPYTNTMRLMNSFSPQQVTLRVVENSNHQTISDAPAYFALMLEFLSAPTVPQISSDNITSTRLLVE